MTVENSYIEVAVAVPVYHTFTYSVPQYLLPFVAAGKRVLVPFGRRRVTGYILGSSQDCGTAEIKHILVGLPFILSNIKLFYFFCSGSIYFS